MRIILGSIIPILLLLVVAGCLYKSWSKDSQGGQGEEERCLVGTRRRVRAAVGSLEERLGVALWPRSKREGGGGDDDDDNDDGGEAGGRARDQEVEEKEDSDDSSQEEEEEDKKAVEVAPSGLQMEQEKRRQEEEEEDETSSESEDDDESGGGGAAAGGAEKVSLEETVPATAAPDKQQGADVFEVTVL